MFNDEALKIIEDKCTSHKVVLNGPTGSGKTTILQERYKFLVEKLGVSSERILVLFPNSHSMDCWRENVSVDSSGALWWNTFHGFIKEELKIYYPLVLNNCNEIINKSIKPVFLSYDISCFLLSRVIQWQRENKGAFSFITAQTSKIASDLYTNLLKAAVSGVPHTEIGERLYSSLEVKDELRQQTLNDADSVLRAYRKKCLELGKMDFCMAAELYAGCLLKDETYRVHLLDRIEHLIVENIEAAEPALVDIIGLLLSSVKTCYISYNCQGGYGELCGLSYEYAVRKLVNNPLLKSISTFQTNKPHTCSSFMNEFSEMLFDNIEGYSDHKIKPAVQIERNPPSELRSEMLEKLGLRICKLVLEEGYKPSDVFVLSTYSDPVTEYILCQTLGKQGIGMANTARRARFIDNELCLALITLAQICYPACSIYPNIDHIKAMLITLTGIDAVRSSILAGEISKVKPWASFPDISEERYKRRLIGINTSRYQHLRHWTRQFISDTGSMPMHDFFQRAFLELVITENTTQNQIKTVNELVHKAQQFYEIITGFNNIKPDKGFIETVLGGMTEESISAQGHISGQEAVTFTTPQLFLSGSLYGKVVILTSISSKNWSPRYVKELTNPQVLSAEWKLGGIYGEEMEQKNQRHYLAVMMRNILKRCGERLIIFESNLSSAGFENDGVLADCFEEIIQK